MSCLDDFLLYALQFTSLYKLNIKKSFYPSQKQQQQKNRWIDEWMDGWMNGKQV